MSFNHGDTVRKADGAQGALGVLGLVTLKREYAASLSQYSVLWEDTFTHTWEKEDALKLVKRLPIV